MSETIPAAFADAVRRDPTVPLLTFYDDASGDRTELSGATLDNWVSKTANMLADGSGLGAGDTVAVLLPPHWQTAAILLGAWSAGLALDLGENADAVFTTPDQAETTPDQAETTPDQAGTTPDQAETKPDQAGTTPHRAGTTPAARAGDRYATGLLPFAMPLRQVPPGYADYVVEVRAFGDRFIPIRAVISDDPAFAGTSHREAVHTARERASELGISPGDRVLVDARTHPDPADWLLAPLVAGASTVLCANLDPAAVAKRIAAERVTVTMA